MPVVTGTPESVLPRTDSKNPTTTCKGLTSNGRRCRRSLASSGNDNQGILAILPHVGHRHNHGHRSTAAYYCWQHKDQASNLVGESGEILELKQRSSIDTLMEKLGVLDLEDNKGKSKKSKQSTVKRNSLPIQRTNAPGPLMSVPEDPFEPVPTPEVVPNRRQRSVPRRRERVHISLFCCMRAPKDNVMPPSRPRPNHQASSQNSSIPYQTSLQAMPNTLEHRLSFIPQTLSSTIRTNLMSELSRPLTASDHESGYIYFFWLTPKDVPQEAAQAASSLLVPTDRNTTPKSSRRTSDVLRDFNHIETVDSLSKPKTIMLKIGRASNVHRRMVQWSQQCGHHITLLRYYPYHDKRSSLTKSTMSPSSGAVPSTSAHGRLLPRDQSPTPLQKAPFIPRVERLIHLELADKQVKRNCEGCGKEHREWFEVEATRQGIREVDAVVRRWITWAQQRSS